MPHVWHRGKVCWLCWLICALVVATGCSEQKQDLATSDENDIKLRNDTKLTATEQNRIYMADNAMLRDSSISDVHFVPHAAALNGVGVKRLTRMAELLSACGGTICYETSLGDQELIGRRLACVREFLHGTGVGDQKIKVEAGRSRGGGMAAIDAMLIQAAARERLGGTGSSSEGTSQ